MNLKTSFKGKNVLIGISILFAVFIFSLSTYAAVDEIVTGQDKFSNYDEIQQRVSTRGEIRVIVKLDVPGIKELTAASIAVRKPGARKEAASSRTMADTGLKDAIASAAHAVLDKLEGARFRVNHIYPYIPYMALGVSEDAFAILESLPEVLYIQWDKENEVAKPVRDNRETTGGISSTSAGISKPMLAGSLQIIGADEAHNMGYTGAGYYVAFLDTGILNTHEAFQNKTIIEACFSHGDGGTLSKSIFSGDCPGGGTVEYGTNSAAHHPDTYLGWDHGTQVAGIAVGNSAGCLGVAKDANIIAVQASHKYEDGDEHSVYFWPSDVAAGLNYVYGLHGTSLNHQAIRIAAVNVSTGGGSYSAACDNDVRAAAINALNAIDIPTLVASGNMESCVSVSAPACVSTAVAVGATTRDDEVERFTNSHETMLALLAPGEDINTAGGGSDDGTAVILHTSAATPHVSGAWTLLKQAKPNASVRSLLEALRGTGVPVSPRPNCTQLVTPKPRIQVDEALTATDPIVTTPNNGETWERGTTQVITWYTGDIAGNVKLELRRQDGSYVGLIEDNIAPDACSYSWDVGTLQGGSAAYADDYVIRVSDMNSTVYDDSDMPISIPGVKLTSPNGGERWKLGSLKNITWVAGGFSENVKLVLWRNGNHVGLIESFLNAASGSYSWEVGRLDNGTIVSVGTTYTIRVAQVSGEMYYDDSDDMFTIGNITVNSPAAGETWEIGDTETITWNTGEVSNTVKLVLWKDGNNIGIIATGIPPDTGFYNWTVGQLDDGGTAAAGTGYTIRVREQGGSHILDDSGAFTLALPAQQVPFQTMFLPGTIEAEDYDNGGEGIAYHDTTPGNICNPPRYRFDDVDIQTCYDSGGGYNVGWIEVGEWLEYTVTVTQSGYYDIGVRAAAPNGGAFSLHTVDGGTVTPLTGYREFLATGGSQEWETVIIPRVFLSAGETILRFEAETGYFNLNRITGSLSVQSPYGGSTGAVPGIIQAEDYDVGGEGIAYHDTTSGNTCYYSAYRFDDVDVENSPDSGPDTINVGYIDTGEWLEYTVDITQSGYYDIVSRVAPPTSPGGSFSMEIDSIVFGTVTFPDSGLGPQDYTSVTLSNVYLPKGKAVLKINMLLPLWNFDYIQFIKR